MRFYLLSISILIYCLAAKGQNVHLNRSNPEFVGFTENRGQVTDQYGCPREDLDFMVKASDGLSIFIGEGKISYQFSNPISGCEKEGSTDMYRLDMTLIDVNPNARLVKKNKLARYERYHTASINTCDKPVQTFGSITYEDVWPGIDWVLYGKEGHIEYDFIVHPGSDPSRIKIVYGGATELVKNGDRITAKTPLGSVTERNLDCYIQENGRRVASTFVVNANSVAFDVERQPGTLVIDPTLEWSTYFGRNGNETGFAITADNLGHIYTLGPTSSTSSIATTGSYQSTYGGNGDIFLAKFTAGGSLLWATYYGGSGGESGNGHIAIDPAGNIYFTGTTESHDSIATSGAYQATLHGTQDAFLAKFDPSGMLIWATYFGGDSGDVGYDVTSDTSGNIYLCGSTVSATGLSTPGAYQVTYGGGFNDGFLARFTPGGALTWATYFGGSVNDPAYRVATDKMDNIYLAGATNSPDHIATASAHNTVLGTVSYDAYLAKFQSSGSLLWATYYGGNALEEGVKGLVCDTIGNVYMSGSTASTDSIATPGAHQAALGGPSDAYLAKFDPNGVLVWGTYYGGGSDDAAYDLFYRKGGWLYTAGSTKSNDSIATSGGFKTHHSGPTGDDAFLAEFTTNGALTYGTYFGGVKTDLAYGVTADDSGNVYMTGQTRSTDSIATPGAYQTVLSGITDMFVVKFKRDSILAPVDTTTMTTRLSTGDPMHVTTWPNPAVNSLQINCTGCQFREVVLFDISGHPVNHFIGPVASNKCTLDVKGLAPGIYLYKLYGSEGAIKTGKFLKE